MVQEVERLKHHDELTLVLFDLVAAALQEIDCIGELVALVLSRIDAARDNCAPFGVDATSDCARLVDVSKDLLLVVLST